MCHFFTWSTGSTISWKVESLFSNSRDCFWCANSFMVVSLQSKIWGSTWEWTISKANSRFSVDDDIWSLDIIGLWGSFSSYAFRCSDCCWPLFGLFVFFQPWLFCISVSLGTFHEILPSMSFWLLSLYFRLNIYADLLQPSLLYILPLE